MVVCRTNHERPDCARINMEIVKLNYPEPWLIVHSCSDRTMSHTWKRLSVTETGLQAGT